MTPETQSRVLYDNLDTTFVNLWALLRTLTQRGFIGRVHVELEDYTADVFMTGSSTPLVHEIDRTAGTDTLEEAALHRLVLRVRETPGTITVFEGAGEAAAVQALVTPDHDNHDSVKERTPEDLAMQYEPEAPTETDEIKPLSLEPSIPVRIERPAEETGAVQELVEQVAPTPPIVVSAEPVDEIEWTAVVRIGGEIIGAVERAVTGAGADFTEVFNDARLALADDYVFLDPLSGQLTYSTAEVTLNGEVASGAFVSGLSEAMRRVVNNVATGERARRVRERVALELYSVARKRSEILPRSGFLSRLDRIAGTKVL
jgi:hypothetical protein